MIPHERSLVTRMGKRPFELIGVNSDKPDVLQRELTQNQINWRSFKNEQPDQGPITRAWSVRGHPALFLIDHKGVIRHKWVGNPGDEVIERAVEALVKDAEKDAKKK
jgi:AhpC/TSA family